MKNIILLFFLAFETQSYGRDPFTAPICNAAHDLLTLDIARGVDTKPEDERIIKLCADTKLKHVYEKYEFQCNDPILLRKFLDSVARKIKASDFYQFKELIGIHCFMELRKMEHFK